MESPNRDTSLILSSFEDAVKTYDLTWRIREASEASTRELHGSGGSSATFGAQSAEVPASLESTTTATAGPTLANDNEGQSSKGLIESVKEGVEKVGLGGKTE